jgi:ribosome-binding factor A
MTLTKEELKQKSLGKVAENIKRILSNLQIEGEFDKLHLPYFTVTEAQMKGPDYAKIFISTYDNKTEQAVKKLNEDKQTIRYELAQRLKVKTVPNIEFIPDNTYDKGKKIEELLNQA